MSIIAKYKFDSSVYADLMPEFNSEFTNYTVTDEVDRGNSNHIIRTIESDSLPTLMRFGSNLDTYVESSEVALLEVLDMNTSGLTSCYRMFMYCKNLTSITCEWNTSNVTSMYHMFSNCYKLTSLDVSNFDTSKVTVMQSMFYHCYNLTSLDVSKWNTSKVTNISHMFYNCKLLTSLDVSNWNTSNVNDMQQMFDMCYTLNVDVSNWDTSNVTNIYAMFGDCRAMTSLDLTKWNTSKMTNMLGVFWGCINLVELNISSWDTSKVTNMKKMFYDCIKLTTLDVSNFNTSNVTDASDMFSNTPLLKDIGMLYCDQSTINKVASLLPTDITQAIWVEDVDVKDLTPVEGVDFKQYAKNTEVMLTSPLLEGDKLIVKDGKTYHYHKMGKVVLDGSENYGWNAFGGDDITHNRGTTIGFHKTGSKGSRLPNQKQYLSPSQLFSDRFKVGNHNQSYANKRWITADNTFNLCFDWNELPERTSDGVNQWLQQNPTTVVYELETPYYELISEDSLDISLIAESSDITNSSNIPLNMTINNRGLSTVAMSPSTTYTVAFDKDTDGEVVVNLCGNEVTTTDNIVEITTPSEIDNELIFYGDGVEVSNVRLLEGSMSGDSVPRESFKGLKSSFEDGYIPESINNSLEFNTFENTNVYSTFEGNTLYYSSQPDFNDPISPSGISQIKGLEPSKVYTIAFKCDKDFQFAIAYGSEGWYYSEVGSPREVYANEFFIDKFTCLDYEYAFIRLLQCDDSVRDITFSNMTILEGDWTHLTLTEEDWNNLGKYKVEYKVTGKNKLPNSEGWVHGQLLTDGALSVYEAYATVSISTENFIPVHKGVTYTISFPSNYEVAYHLWDKSYTHLSDSNWLPSNIHTFTPDKDGYTKITGRLKGSLDSLQPTNPEDIDKSFTIQLEVGTQTTEYEPYKEYTKTFYLNSPLLEGDTIEDINGVATHVKRRHKFVVDGSNDEEWYSHTVWDTYQRIRILLPFGGMSDRVAMCDNYKCLHGDWEDNYMRVSTEVAWYYTTDLSMTVDDLRAMLRNKPATLVYELASPIYEPISTESILCDSYVNGHLDFDTNIPIEKAEFNRTIIPLKYQSNSTNYIVKFDSDNNGVINEVFFGGSNNPGLKNVIISKGINILNVATGNGTIANSIYFKGIGFNASNIQVVATDRDVDFGYFKGLQSSFENNMENLWDGTLVEGAHISTNSTYSKSISKTRSAYIKCRPNTTYIITATNNDRLRIGHVSELVNEIPCMISDIDDTNISYKEFTTTHREGYLIVYVANEGNTNENITVDIREKANKVECKVVGKNKAPFIKINCDDVLYTDVVLKKGATYTISSDLPIETGDIKINKEFANQGFRVSGQQIQNWGQAINTFTSEYSGLCRIWFWREGIHNQNVLSSWIQIEEGTQATPYEPYKEYTKTIYLNSPLLKGDKIEVHNGKLCHYHKMGMVVLDGSEDESWTAYQQATTTISYGAIKLYDMKQSMKSVVICDNYVSTNDGTKYDASYTKEQCYPYLYPDDINFNRIYFHVLNSKLPSCTIEGFKQWFANNPTTVVYELVEPYYEEISPLQEDLIITSVKEGDLHIDTIVPISSKVTYNVNVQLLTDFEQSIVEQVQATQTTDLQSILDEEIDN